MLGLFLVPSIITHSLLSSSYSKVVCFLLKSFYGVSIPDANAPYRLMKTDTLRKYLYRLPMDYALPNIMITTFFVYYKEPVDFSVITFQPRQYGTNSINIHKIIRIGLKAMRDFYRFKKEM